MKKNREIRNERKARILLKKKKKEKRKEGKQGETRMREEGGDKDKEKKIL